MALPRNPLKMASIGYTFNHPDVEDISFGSPRTLLGQDVVLLKIGHLQYDYSFGYTGSRYRGKVSLSSDASTRISEDIERRKRELRTLLEVGGTLVLFLPAPELWYVDTGRRQFSGTGRNRQTTVLVSEMHLLSSLPFAIDTVAAETRDMELKAGDPFATFWQACGYRFESAAALTAPFGETTLVIRGTESIVGSIARVDKGLVISLPEVLLYPVENEEPKTENEADAVDDLEKLETEAGEGELHSWDSDFLDALSDLVRALRSRSGDFLQPEWAREYLLPGEDEARDKVRQVSKSVVRARERLDDANRQLALREQRKTLVTGTGPALVALVEEALTALGFAVEEGRPTRVDRIVHLGKHTAVVEIKGLTKSAGEKDAAQLEKWVNEYYLEHSQKAKGILVANGWRARPLAERKRPVFPQQMLKYSESRSHCLISSVQLLGAWLDSEAHPKKRKTISKSILDCVGEYQEYADWSQFLQYVQGRKEEVTEVVHDSDGREAGT